MINRREKHPQAKTLVERKRLLSARTEWIGLVLFAGAALLVLPFVKAAVVLQQVWLTMCAAVGLTQ